MAGSLHYVDWVIVSRMYWNIEFKFLVFENPEEGSIWKGCSANPIPSLDSEALPECWYPNDAKTPDYVAILSNYTIMSIVNKNVIMYVHSC